MAKQLKKSSPPLAKGARVGQIFSFNAPNAKNVALVGNFTDWQNRPIPLQKEAGGIWRVTVPLTPDEYRYRFLVDGEWQDDPECLTMTENPYGSQDAVIRVGNPTAVSCGEADHQCLRDCGKCRNAEQKI